MRSQSVRSGPAPPFPMGLPSMRQKRSQARERQELSQPSRFQTSRYDAAKT